LTQPLPASALGEEWAARQAKAITDINFQENQSGPGEHEYQECDLKNRETGEEMERK
jgi:hypothetical protein